MFVERKLNKSGSTTVRIMQKVQGKRKCIKVMGCSSDAEEVSLLVRRGNRWIEERKTGEPLFAFEDEASAYDRVLANLRQSQLRLVGPELVYGTLFDRVGYGRVKTANNDLLRALVVTLLYHPGSRLRTAEYMERFMHRSYSPDSIYRFLDELCARSATAEQIREATDENIGVKWQVEQVSFERTKAAMGGQMTVAFASVNNRGYNRFLSLQGETAVTIDRSKIAEDARLDGLKGYVTNSKIKDGDVVGNYRNLHFIERAFRMNKTDLAIRPIYHRLFNRIEAHVCICFAA